jgi:hypothetical protein
MELMLSEKKHKVFLGWLLLHSTLNTREIFQRKISSLLDHNIAKAYIKSFESPH